MSSILQGIRQRIAGCSSCAKRAAMKRKILSGEREIEHATVGGKQLSVGKKSFTPFDAVKDILSGRDDLIVSEETKKKRLSVCNSCPQLDSRIGQCQSCGCFVKLKTHFARAECPIKKWSAINVEG